MSREQELWLDWEDVEEFPGQVKAPHRTLPNHHWLVVPIHTTSGKERSLLFLVGRTEPLYRGSYSSTAEACYAAGAM